jgi:F-type H+-transporting ATPase subunit epsilon
MALTVEVVSQERKLFEVDDVDIVIVPGSEGILGIMPNHTPLITTLQNGELIIRKGGAEEIFAIFGGFVEVRPNKVLVLADAADFAADINLKEAEEARDRIKALIAQGLPPEEEALVAADYRRAELAINIARKTQSRSGSVGIRIVKDKKDE